MRTLIIVILLHAFVINGIGQVVSDPIYFYGYDITRAKVTDPKRAGQELDRYMLELVGALNEGVTLKKMNRWMKPHEVKFRLNTLFESNRKVKTDNIFFPNYRGNRLLNRDSVEHIIKSYPIAEQSGTGFVIIFEFFSKERKSVSGHGCIFDIKSRKIIKYATAEFRDGNGYNRFTDYWVPATYLVETLCNEFKQGN